MKDDYLPEGLRKTMEAIVEATRPYREAVDVLKHNTEFVTAITDPLVDKFGVMDNAWAKGMFDENLTKSISELLMPYHELTGAQEVIRSLGTSFDKMIKPDVYASVNEMAKTIAEYSIHSVCSTTTFFPKIWASGP